MTSSVKSKLSPNNMSCEFGLFGSCSWLPAYSTQLHAVSSGTLVRMRRDLEAHKTNSAAFSDKPSPMEAFPMREWSLKIFLLDEDGNERPADVFNKVVYNLHPTFENPVQSMNPFLAIRLDFSRLLK